MREPSNERRRAAEAPTDTDRVRIADDIAPAETRRYRYYLGTVT